MKQWVVYVTPENRVEAIEDDHKGTLEFELTSEHNTVVGWISSKHKVDAIDYVKQVLL